MIIQSYNPKSDENTLYIKANIGFTAEFIINVIKDYFKTTDLREFNIRSKAIQTRCLGYDFCNSSDYDNFIIIERVK